MANTPYKITLDTNCIVNAFDRKAHSPTSVDALECIIALSKQGFLDLAVTTCVEVDQYNDHENDRIKRIWEGVAQSPIAIISTPDFNESSAAELKAELMRTLYPKGINWKANCAVNKENDIKHLASHKVNQRDIFITDDKGILNKKDTLEKTHAITVMSPAELVDFVRFRLSQPHIIATATSYSKHYVSQALEGRVSFDYSNNNGYFRIGHGIYTFDTCWTKASDTSIHATNDGANIESIARVKDTSNITELKNIEKYDFSSRCRTIELNEILLLKNTNGFYAALKITKIQDDSREDDADLLEFDYVIKISPKDIFIDS